MIHIERLVVGGGILAAIALGTYFLTQYVSLSGFLVGTGMVISYILGEMLLLVYGDDE